jgi:DNA mismatch repair protein MutS2
VSALWTAETAAEIGVDWLEREIAPAADFGRRSRENERPFQRGDEVPARAAIALVADVAREVAPEALAALRDAIAGCPDPAAAVARARAGVVLADGDFFEVARFLDAVALIRSLAREDVFARTPLPPRDERLAALLEIGRTRERSFYLADAFDGDLASARRRAVEERVRLDAERARLTAHVASFAGLDHIRDGEFVLMRDRVTGQLPPEIRVLREAPTYYLCEIALDAPALGALSAVDVAEAAVAELEERGRARLTDHVARSAATFDAASVAIGRLDSLVARVRFAQRHDARVPEIAPEPALEFEQARLLPLSGSLSAHGHRYSPLSLDLAGVAVLTGPNMGGKSAALRTCGFVAACVALGLPVPATAARVGLFDAIAWIGGGDERERESLLSSFGREVAQLRDFLAGGAPRALALVDEFARTTSPREGRALLIALLETLRARGALALAATHLSEIASAAGVPHFAVAGLRELPQPPEGPPDLDDAIERIAKVMDYRVLRVDEDAEPRADALALAEVLGLDRELVARARAAL